MPQQELFAIAISLTAFFAFLNYRYFKLPVTIGAMAVASCFSLILLVSDYLGFPISNLPRVFISSIDFDDTLLHAMLGPLLFAGAMFVNLDDLLKQKWTILTFASIGVLVSMMIVATLFFYASQLVGIELQWIWCLLFGALISPTDPIAVLGILKKLGVPKSLEIKFTGESLFNDGIGVVLFIVLLSILQGNEATPAYISELFIVEVGGGILLGLILGATVYALMKRIDNYQVEILLSLALISGGYALATHFHLSGPIFAVIAGLLIGNSGRRHAMSDKTREHLDTFWELIDEILNTVLFVLIGLELLVIALKPENLLLGIMAIVIVLFARFVGIGSLIQLLRFKREFSHRAIRILTWGGLRGGISIALALSLPLGPERSVIVTVTYVVVAFSILVQGLTIGKLITAASKDN
jgi:monovalent cation:H+ antiporter, CPA1 family